MSGAMVSWTYWYLLIVIAAVGMLGRFASNALPITAIAYRLRPGEAVLAFGSLLALGVHCFAMFFPSQARAVPGLDTVVDPIRQLGVASQLAYAIPATILVLAVRRSWRPGPVALAVALTAVGVTMYWSFGLNTHLTTIAIVVAVSVALMAGTLRAPSLRLQRSD